MQPLEYWYGVVRRRTSQTEVNNQSDPWIELIVTCLWPRQAIKLERICCDMICKRMSSVRFTCLYYAMYEWIVPRLSTQICGGYWLVAQLPNDATAIPGHSTNDSDDGISENSPKVPPMWCVIQQKWRIKTNKVILKYCNIIIFMDCTLLLRIHVTCLLKFSMKSPNTSSVKLLSDWDQWLLLIDLGSW